MSENWNIFKEIKPTKETKYLVCTKKGEVKIDRWEISTGWVQLDKYLRGQYGTTGTYIYAWIDIPEPPLNEKQIEYIRLAEEKAKLSRRISELNKELKEI